MLTSSHSSAPTEDEGSGTNQEILAYLLKPLSLEEPEFKPRSSDTKACVLSTLLTTPLFFIRIIRTTIFDVFYVFAVIIFLAFCTSNFIEPSQQPYEVGNMDRRGNWGSDRSSHLLKFTQLRSCRVWFQSWAFLSDCSRGSLGVMREKIHPSS